MTLRILTSGLDALYLSGTAELRPAFLALLEARRESAAKHGNVQVPLGIGPSGLTVGWGPWNNYRFRLEHPNALIGLTQSAFLPTMRIQPRAEFLHAVGPEAVIEWCSEVAKSVLGSEVVWQVSRVDLFADVQGWEIQAADRRRFAARAKARRTYEEGEDLTGLQWGAGKKTLARIYDKSIEIRKNGKDWWPSVWGTAYDPSERVVRIEFQVNRAALHDFDGLDGPHHVLAARRPLWRHLTDKWLSLRVASDDSNLSRRDVDDAWRAIQSADLGSAPIGADLVRAGKVAGERRIIIPGMVGYTTSLGALDGATTIDELLDVIRTELVEDERNRGVSVGERLFRKSQGYVA